MCNPYEILDAQLFDQSVRKERRIDGFDSLGELYAELI
jgi:hypothetical protein